MSIDLGSINSRLTLNISNFSANLRRAEEEIQETERRFSGFADIGNRFENLGEKLTLGVTMPIVGIGVAASKIGMDFESQMSRVKAISQSTESEFKSLEQAALDLGQSTAFSAKEVAEAQENMASAGFKVNEILASTPGILDLAASSGTDLGNASAIAAGAIRGFGLEANEAGRVADVLARAAADTNANVQTMGDAFKYVSPVARGVGWSIESVSAAIGKMADASIDGSTAGTTLRGAITRLANPSDEAAKKMKELGFRAFDNNGKMKGLSTIVDELGKATKNLTQEQKQQAIAEIFGQEAMSGMLVLMQTGKGGLDRLTTSFQNSSGAAKDMAKTMQDNAKSSVEQMMGSLETAAIKIEKVIAPTITKMADGVGKLADKFSALSPETQENIIKFGLLAASAGPVVLIFGKMFSSVTAIAGGLRTVSTLMGITRVATTATGTAATVAAGVGTTGGVAGLGAALSGVVAASAPFLVAGAAVAGVGYAVYKGMSQEAIPAVDLFADKIEATADTTVESNGEIIQSYEQTTIKINEATQNAIGAYMELDKSATEQINNLYTNSSTITEKIKVDTISKFDDMKTQVVKGYETQKNDSINKLKEMFKDSSDLTKEEQKQLIDSTKKHYDEQSKIVQDYEAKIKEIMNTASKEKRSLTEGEVKTIEELQRTMRENSVKALSENEVEAKVILQRMKDYDQRITAEQSAQHIKQLNESRDKAVATANDEYNKRIALIERLKSEGVIKSQEQADKMIADAKRQRDETVSKAEQTRLGVLDKIRSMNSDLDKEVDTSTGKILTRWDKLKRWWSGWKPESKNFNYEVSETANGFRDLRKYASGTNYHPGGLALAGEEGEELVIGPNGQLGLTADRPTLYNLARGTQVIPHEITKELLNSIPSYADGVGLLSTSRISNTSVANNQQIGSLLNVEKVIINNEMDIESLVNELEYYRKKVQMGTGGVSFAQF